MAGILVIVDRVRGSVDESAWELLSAARSIAREGEKVSALLLGHEVSELAQGLTHGFDAVHVFDHERLASPDGEADALALKPLIEREGYGLLLTAHTNRAIDLVPKLAAQLDVPLLGDCLQVAWRGEELTAVRTMYGGKVHARFRAAHSTKGYAVTIRGGAFAAQEKSAEPTCSVTQETYPGDGPRARRMLRTVEPEAGAVDISQSEVLVAVGRGIDDEENLELVQSLVAALGAELCCSRPIVDKGWLPKSRQVGTSGTEVRPKVYVALGISGSFQHLGGIKGSPYMVAVNNDRSAPIFGVADVGIVGDLVEVLPEVEKAVRKAKS